MSTTVHKLLIEAEADTKGVTKMQKELTTLYKEQQKSTKNAASQHLKAKNQSKETAKLTGPDAIKKQDAAARRLLETEKKLTAEAKKQAQIAKDLKATNRLAQRTTFSGGFRKAMGFRQPGDMEGPNWRARMGAAVGGGIRTGIGMAGGGLAALMMAPIAAVGPQYQAYSSYSRSLAQVSGMGRGMPFGRGGVDYASVRALAGRGAELGFMPEETVDALHSMGRAVGTRGATDATDLGMGASRLTGQSIQELSQFMTEQRRGSGAFGTQQRREFQQVLQTAVEAGMDASTLPEYMEGIQTLLQSANQRGGTNSPAQIAALLAMAQRTGAAGLQGARGVATVSGVDQGIRNAGNINMGMGNFFNALVMQQAGLGRGASYTSAAGRAQQGLLQPGGLDLADVRAVINRARSSGLSGSLLNQGLVDAGWAQTQTQAQDVLTLADQPGSDAQLRALLQRTSETELDVQHEIADHTERIADLLGVYTATAAHGVIGAAGTALANVDVGHDLAGPLEELQRIMQQFIEGPMHDLIEDVITQLPPLLRTVTTSISAAAEAIHRLANPGEGTASITEVGSVQDLFGQTADLAGTWRRFQQSEEQETPEQLQTLLESVQQTSDQYARLMNNPAISVLESANTDALESDAQRRSQLATEIATELARVLREQPPVHRVVLDEVRISAPQDGLSATPPSPRTVVSTTGSGR